MDVLTERLGRFGPLFLLATLSWTLPATAGATLLQALFAQVDDANKIALTAAVSTLAAAAGAVTVVVAGALSDRTAGRLGRRRPWILGGALVSAAALSLMPVAGDVGTVAVLYALFQVGLNAMVAALSALLPDRVGPRLLGRASALGGLGNLLGLALGGFVAAGFVTVPRLGLAVVPWGMVLAAVTICLVLPDPPAAPGRATSLRPPRDRDFWLAFAGRLAFLLSLLTVLTYQLYLLTDHYRLSTVQAAQLIAVAGVVLAVGAGLAAAVTGPLSDRVGRRKPFVVGAALVAACAFAILAVDGGPATFLAFSAVASLAYGTFIAVDQALMVEVLPDRRHSARDLGFLTVANTAPGIVAPALAGGLVAAAGFPALFVAGIVLALAGAACILPITRVR